MRILFLVVGLWIPIILQAQKIVNIPDQNFKAALIAAKIDTSGDGEIQIGEAALLTDINVSSLAITDLTGIKAFTSLRTLQCIQNKLISLDVSGMPTLTMLNCSDNNLTTLLVDYDTSLFQINCDHNLLTSIDVSTLHRLSILFCPVNWLTSLDVNHNPILREMDCVINSNLKQICLSPEQMNNLDSVNFLKNPAAQWNGNCNNVTSVLLNSKKDINKIPDKIYNVYGSEVLKDEAIEGLFIYYYKDGSSLKIIHSGI